MLFTIGAAIPILGIMFFHFCIRKNFYRKLIAYFETDAKRTDNRISTMQNLITGMVQSFQNGGHPLVKTYLDLLALSSLTPGESNSIKIVVELENQKKTAEIELLKIKNDLEYVRKYNFTRYLLGFANDRFPDGHFRAKET